MQEDQIKEIRELIRIGVNAIGHKVLLSSIIPLNILYSSSAKISDRKEYARWIVDQALKYYGISDVTVCVSFDDMSGKGGFILYRNRSWFLNINRKHIDDDIKIIAIIAHEIAHVLLDIRGINLEPNIRNEKLTDVVAILTGFGRAINLVSENERLKPELLIMGVLSVEKETIGYLSEEEIYYVSNIKNLISNSLISKKRYRVNICLEDHFICNACGTHLKIHKVSGMFVIKCPVCLLRQAVLHMAKNKNIYGYDLLKCMLYKFYNFVGCVQNRNNG